MNPDDTKLRELILYIAQSCEADQWFSRTKLNKILFDADFEAYATLGKSITGHPYVKQPRGPVPSRARGLLEEMQSTGEVRVLTRECYGRTQERPVALREADLRVISPEERTVVDQSIRKFWGKTARQSSEITHRESAGWRAVQMGEEIEYDTVFLSPRPLSKAQVLYGQELARVGR